MDLPVKLTQRNQLVPELDVGKGRPFAVLAVQDWWWIPENSR